MGYDSYAELTDEGEKILGSLFIDFCHNHGVDIEIEDIDINAPIEFSEGKDFNLKKVEPHKRFSIFYLLGIT